MKDKIDIKNVIGMLILFTTILISSLAHAAEANENCKLFSDIETPSLTSNDLYVPFHNYYNSFPLIRATRTALFINSCKPPCWETMYSIVNLGNNSVTSIDKKYFSEDFFWSVPEISLKEEGRILKLEAFAIKEVLENGILIRKSNLDFDLSKNTVVAAKTLQEKVFINDKYGYLKELLSTQSYRKYWTDGSNFLIASHLTSDEESRPLAIFFGRKGGVIFKTEIPNPTEKELSLAYKDDYVAFCGNSVGTVAIHKEKSVYGIEFYGGEGCRSLGGMGTLDFNSGESIFYKAKHLAKYSAHKILPVMEGSLLVIPIWKGEGGSGRWNGPWIYNLKSDEWRELVDIRRREVILDTAIGGNDLWFATDRKLYRFNIALNQHPKIYAFSEDRKRLIHINKEIIAVALKGSKNQRRWGIFWLSEEPVLSLKGELLRLLNEDDKEIQKLALRGVGRAKIIEALPILSDMKKDIDLASFVVFALYSIRSDKVKGLLESFCLEEIEGYCSKSIEALSCMDNGTSSFKRLLKIKSPYNLASIVYYLSKAQDEETVLLLLNLAEKVSAARKAQGKFYNYSRGNPWYRLNQTLIESFGEIRDKRAVMWLKKEYEDNKDIETKLMILDSIAAILRTEAIPYLEKVATSEANAQILDRVDKILLMLGGR